MQRNTTITTVFLTSSGATTPIPWVNNAPDFSAFTEPTLSILQAAFERGDYEIIPDPESIPEPVVPDWNGFYNQLLMSQTYQFLLSQTIPKPSISGAMAVLGFAIKDGRDDPSNPSRLAAFQSAVNVLFAALNIVEISLSDEQLIEIRGLLDINGFELITLE